MNIYRKMMGHSKASSSSLSSTSSNLPQSTSDLSLGLTHLRKLFAEFRHPSSTASTLELEGKLYNMLPLFCKVFGNSPSSEMTEKFGDILQFCSHVSRLMSAEIRRRASNQSTEAASCAIAHFLEIESSEEASNGWMLLSTINLLTSGGQSLIDCMTVNSLPSTLVKCLYLFFDLPDVDGNGVGGANATISQFSPLERRVLLQKMFVQVLIKLCSYAGPAEELARRDDLTLLFSAITSWCPGHNVAWRKSSAEVLMTLSRHGLTPSVVQYIHTKGCVSLCIDNMKRSQELAPLELVEMFVTVFCFLKDSSEVSQVLLDDFRACQGYLYLSEFLLRLETDLQDDSMQALRNLVLLVGSLTTCGFTELRPSQASSGSLFSMPGFTLPSPAGKGISVRNLQAFQVLQSVFMKAQSTHLCSVILDVISSIYHQDNANYFILEPENTLSQFAEKIHLKPPEIQVKFFEILEFVIFHLNFIPCKELISLSLLIKMQQSIACTSICIRSLLKMVRYQAVFKDVCREVGLLEVIVTCLHRHAALFKESADGKEKTPISEEQQVLGNLVMEALSILLSGNSNNAAVFRECGGARCALNMVPYPDCRQQVLRIVQQLIVSSGGEDDMGTLLGLMHSAPVEAVELKQQILKALLNILRESHKTRTVFRKTGGFVYVMSVLVSMEGCLAEPPKAPWDTVDRRHIVSLLKTVFSTLTVAMRYEPANAKFFATDVHYASLTDAVRLLGCFSTHDEVQPPSSQLTVSEDPVFTDFFHHAKEHRIKKDIPKELLSACLMLRFLYDMALDNYDFKFSKHGTDSPHLKRMTSVFELPESSRGSPVNKRASMGSINMKDMHQSPPAIVVHSGALVSMFHLMPGIVCQRNSQMELDLQYCIAKVLKTIMKTERNQQVMCEAGLPHELLTRCKVALEDETHPLHPPLQYIFERLAAQSLTSKDLRDFLRLNTPLSCSAIEEEIESTQSWSCNSGTSSAIPRTDSGLKIPKTNGGAVPLTRVKCLVSMTTPRDVRLHGASVTPAFVEFDMAIEGFGCLYLPSIAPQGPPAPSVVGVGMVGSSDSAVVGGIGTGERLFPPQSGLTFSSWLCIDKFSQSTPTDSHPARLLSIIRNLQGHDENLTCLSVLLNPRDKSLNISTQETQIPNTGGTVEAVEYEPLFNDGTVRIWCPELTQEGQWHHLVVVLHRAGIMKNSSVSLYVDGMHVQTLKLHYISPNIGSGGSATAQSVTSVYACIGTLPALRKASSLTWKQGPCHLFEDIVSSATVEALYNLGPNYVGSFQAPLLEDGKVSEPLINEEKIIFGIHAHSLSLMSIAKIKKIYNKLDSKAIARQLSMSLHENATPIRILHNSAGHLSGPARSLGAVLIGYLGIRTFNPKPVALMLDSVGGTSAMLGLIAMATDVEGLYAAVKALVCVVRSTDTACREMDRTRGYQSLGMLYKKKRHLLNSHILHLTFSLVGTVDSGRESSCIPNRMAFEDLLCDLEVWHDAPGDLQKSLYEHFHELLTESSEQQQNHRLMRQAGLVDKLLHVLQDDGLSQASTTAVAALLMVLLQGVPEQDSLLKFGQFIVSTLPTLSGSEHGLALDNSRTVLETGDAVSDLQVSARKVKIRNICLDILLKLLYNQNNTVNQHISEEIQRVLGFDWLMLFLQEHLHSSSVVLSMRIILAMLGHPATMAKFREGASCSGWLEQTDAVLQDRVGILLDTIKSESSTRNHNREINEEVCHLPGFTALQWLLAKHAHVPELYFFLMALLLGQQVKATPKDVQFDLDSVWTFIFGVPASQPVNIRKAAKTELCPEAANVILAMVRFMLNQPWQTESEGSWLREYPITLSQFFIFLYHNHVEFPALCMGVDFLQGLASTVFPIRTAAESDSEVVSPVDEVKALSDSEPLLVVHKLESSWMGKTGNLSDHPAKKFVMDFLRSVVVDSLSLPAPRGSPPVIDMLLEVSPEHATTRQQREFQTEMLKSLMDHLLAADALLGEEAALPIFNSGSYSNMANNVFYLASRVVDKLWQGTYVRDSMEVFEFVSQLIAQAKRKSSGLSLDSIYKSLNRTILYHLSRPIYSVADQTVVLDALHKLTSNRNLVFGPGNYDQEFIGCLSYCLLQLSEDIDLETRDARFLDASLSQTTWHVDPDSQVEADFLQRSDSTGSEEGQLLLANAARRVWEELYVHKKPTLSAIVKFESRTSSTLTQNAVAALEEIFKVSISSTDASGTTKMATPDLMIVRDLIQEPATRVWTNYIDGEKRNSLKDLEKIQYQLQSKLQKVGSGVLRLARRPTKKEAPVRAVTTTQLDYVQWTFTHVSIVKDLVDLQHKQYLLSLEHMERYLLDEWSQVETELMRERGLWGPPIESSLDKWMLDMTEGPHRMRKKMIRNENFYLHYPHRPEQQNGNGRGKAKGAVSRDSQIYYERYRSHSLVIDQELPVLSGNDLNGDDDDVYPESEKMDLSKAEVFFKTPCLLPRPSSSNKIAGDLDDEQEPDLTSEPGNADVVRPDTSNQTVLRLLEEGEKINHVFRCARIQVLDTAEGLLLFGKEHFYVIDGFTLLKSKEIVDIDTLSPEQQEPIIPMTTTSSRCTKRMCNKFAYEDIREVHKRRYLLQPIAIEVFSADGRNFLLSFPRKLRNKIHARFMAVATAITDNAQQSVSGQKQNAKVEQGTGIISSLIGEKSVTQRWERGEISNFQYLMHLNTLAGRSYNDLMQYPVFPWILANYDSEDLDLSDPNNFRDLSKPMGAQTDGRLAQFRKRYKDWDDPQGETPPYHYGTHYSSAMIVASYLVRMEPFTQIFLKLQGGHFDLADRMFHSIKENWMSASKNNMADVKELIPEFFYLPEFLLNSNKFDLGAKQSGVQLDDAILPAWAKGDPQEFIRVHREALECDFVSAHLNEWIDLVFGYKQQGTPAVEAVNVFHHLFYEGNVDIYSIDDPLKKNATIGFINNFGQIPKQLFKKPHPQKRLSSRLLDSVPGYLAPTPVTKNLFFHHLDNLQPSMQPVKELRGEVGQIVATEKQMLAVEQNKAVIPSVYNRYVAWGFSDLSLRIGTYDSDKVSSVFENLDNGEILCATCPNGRTVITAGKSCVVKVWSLNTARANKNELTLKQPLYAHTEPVTCVTASSAYNVIVSGSRDRTCIIWDMSRLVFVKQLRGHSAPVAAVAINDVTGDIASCAGTYLHVWTINGNLIASINASATETQQILCVAMSQMMEWDTHNVIMTGGSDGVVRMWSVEFVQVPDENKLAIIKEQNELSSSVDGNREDGMRRSLEIFKNPENLLDGSIDFDEKDFKKLGSLGNGDKDLISFDEDSDSKSGEFSMDSAAEEASGETEKGASEVPVVHVDETDVTSAASGSTSRQVSKSSSLGSDFVVIEESEVVSSGLSDNHRKMRRRSQMLREGFKWQKQLVFKSKLTMHTAYERKDNHHPSAVTALAVSKDHKTVYVGDAKGRVFSWSVTSQPGQVIADHWVKDECAEKCSTCEVKFSFSERRHHCRNCGKVFCARCSRYEIEIRRLRIHKPVRVCRNCYPQLRKEQQNSSGKS